MSTDAEWEKWGARDPYYGVITNPKFRSSNLNNEAKQEFFDSGRHHVQYVLDGCRRFIDPAFAPQRVLDFGCGVGRVVIPFAEVCASAVGTDVSPSMLAEARKNCEERGVRNVELIQTSDELSNVLGSFDLVHSAIVFQHIPVDRGRVLFGQLIGLIAGGGIGAIQITFAKSRYPSSFGQPPALPPGARAQVSRSNPKVDPEMQMNCYNLSDLAFMLQTAGIERFHAEFTNHGGELGVFMFFQKPVD